MTEIWPGLTFCVILSTILTACLKLAEAVTDFGINGSRWLPVFIGAMVWCEEKAENLHCFVS